MLKSLKFFLDGTFSQKDLLLYGQKKTKNCTESSPQVCLGSKFRNLMVYFYDGMNLGFEFLSGDEQSSFELCGLVEDTCRFCYAFYFTGNSFFTFTFD